MKQVYPIVLTPTVDGWYAVFVPDFDIDTQGKSVTEAMDMARDAICLWACSKQDKGNVVPNPSDIHNIACNPEDIVTLVDVDIDAYRKTLENRTIRKNLTLPSWLNERAEKEGINFSQVLQDALRERLGIAQ